jgi:hypothetical protein
MQGVFVRKPAGKRSLGRLSTNRREILKWIIKKQGEWCKLDRSVSRQRPLIRTSENVNVPSVL